MTVQELWKLNSGVQWGDKLPMAVEESAKELMRRTDTSPWACRLSRERCNERRATMRPATGLDFIA